ncbi:MAG: class I SAM-dependent methyltransferase [Candidatus Brocadiia bacterium]
MNEISPEELKTHYQLEKRLAESIKKADRPARPVLYKQAYDQLFRDIPHLRAVSQKNDIEQWSKPSPQLKWLKPFLTPETVFLEVGAGNCKLCFEVAGRVRQVYAIEASAEIALHPKYPDNLRLIISDATKLDVPDGSVDVIFSRHLIEHLHPEDGLAHLQAACRALKSGGVYICTTPNRIFGPHDASRGFDAEATGLHLKEYSYGELAGIMRQAAFSRVKAHCKVAGMVMLWPLWLYRLSEAWVGLMPKGFRRVLAGPIGYRWLNTIRLVAWK